MKGDGGKRYCPYCRKIVETRVLPEGYSQERYGNTPSKKRLILHGPIGKVEGACGKTWATLEIIVEDDKSQVM